MHYYGEVILHLQKYSRRLNVSYFFHQGSHYRDILLNAKYLVLLKNVRDRNQFLYLASQAYPEDSHSLYEAYRDAITAAQLSHIGFCPRHGRQTKVSNQCLFR